MSAEPIKEKPMCQLSSMTPAQLNAMTKAQLIEATLQDVRKSAAANEYDAKDRLISQVQTTTDAYDALVGTVSMGLTYYGTGEVDVITVVEYDAQGKETQRMVIKHYTDGRQPVVSSFQAGQGQIEP